VATALGGQRPSGDPAVVAGVALDQVPRLRERFLTTQRDPLLEEFWKCVQGTAVHPLHHGSALFVATAGVDDAGHRTGRPDPRGVPALRVRMDDRVRQRQPLLPVLVAYLEDRYHYLRALLQAASPLTGDETVTVNGRAYQRVWTGADDRRARRGGQIGEHPLRGCLSGYSTGINKSGRAVRRSPALDRHR
jgi:hypothetical protein